MKNTKARLEAAALFLVVFVLGVTFGALGNHVWGQRVSGQTAVHPKPTRDQVLQDLTQRLQLTAEQQREVGAAIDDTRAKWQALDTARDAQHEAIRQQFRANIRASLTPEQQVKFDELIKKREAERQSAH
jgi:Spy/CpxP family protein refolding chaperone